MYLQEILHVIIDHIYIAEDERVILHDAADHVLVTATIDENGRPGLRFTDAREIPDLAPEGA